MKLMDMLKERIIVNNKIVVLWGVIIFSLITLIYVLGVNETKKEDYTEFKELVRLGVDSYMDDNKKWPKSGEIFSISLKDLNKYDYISSLKYNNYNCDGEVFVEKYNNKYNYEYKLKCVNEL